MHFNVLNYLLIFILTVNCIDSTDTSPGELPRNILNEVSDFNDIVEKDFQSNRNPPLKEESELTKGDSTNSEFHHSYDTFEDNPIHDGVFSSSVLGDSDSCKDSVCPKHGIRYRDSGNIPENLEDKDSPVQSKPYLVRLLPKQGIEDAAVETSFHTEDYMLLDDSSTSIPDFVYDFDNAKEDDGCENCNKIKGLYPIPLLESLLINKLLESKDGVEPYPIKYVVKAVLPNVEDLSELDKPEAQRCVKTYLQRRKRQLKFLKKRGAKHKKGHKKKHKKKRKHKSHNRHHRSINDNFDNQLNGIVDYIGKNQTFNDTFTFVPLLFGTVTPAEGQLLLAGVKHNASAEEKFMLQKILSIRPDNIIANLSTAAGPQTSTQEQETQTTVSSLIPANNSIANTENVKYNLHLNLNSPEVKKTIMEIMQRQQNYDTYEAISTKVKRQVSAITVPTSTQVSSDIDLNKSTASASISTKNSTLNTTNGTTEVGTLGLVVASSVPPNDANILPGILIYPKSLKHQKRSADSSLLGNSNQLNDAEISSIIKSFDGLSQRSVTDFEGLKSKKQCKSDKCSEETDAIIDVLNNLNQQSLTLADLGVEDVTYTTVLPLSSLTSSQQLNSAVPINQKQAEFKEDSQMKEKLSKLQKDLKMVQEIQNIFDNVANSKKEQRKEKRSAPIKSAYRKYKHSGSEPDENRYDDEISGLIKARMWQKHNKSFCEDKVKRHNAGKKRSRRFLATN